MFDFLDFLFYNTSTYLMKETKMILKAKNKIHLHFIYTQPEGDFIEGFLFFKINIIILFSPFPFSPSNPLPGVGGWVGEYPLAPARFLSSS